MNVVHAEDGVCFERIEPAGFRILAALDCAVRNVGIDLTITCGTEGHPATDPHAHGEAYDVRTRDLSTETLVKVLGYLRQLLPVDLFTVLLETPVPFTDPRLAALQYVNRHATGPHLHIQRRKGTVFPPPAGPGLVA